MTPEIRRLLDRLLAKMRATVAAGSAYPPDTSTNRELINATVTQWADELEAALLALPAPTIACPACGIQVKQIASATLDIALWQHWNWTCPKRGAPADLPPTEAPVRVFTVAELRTNSHPFEYDQGDVVLCHYDEIYDLLHAPALPPPVEPPPQEDDA
jgi:hypothetical protein